MTDTTTTPVRSKPRFNHVAMSVPADLAPSDYCDPVIEAYKYAVDCTLLRENLKLTVEQRVRKFESAWAFARELRGAALRTRTTGERAGAVRDGGGRRCQPRRGDGGVAPGAAQPARAGAAQPGDPAACPRPAPTPSPGGAVDA